MLFYFKEQRYMIYVNYPAVAWVNSLKWSIQQTVKTLKQFQILHSFAQQSAFTKNHPKHFENTIQSRKFRKYIVRESLFYESDWQ